MEHPERMKLRVRISQVFRPGAPIDRYSLFAGRLNQVQAVVDAAMQPGRHIILFGERGVGKTSLAKVISEIITDAGIKLLDSGTINCDPSDTFSSLWHKIFRDLSVVLEARHVGFTTESGKPSGEKVCLEALLPEKATPDDVRYILAHHLPQQAIIIIDEVDRLRNAEATTLLADTIKNLSDHAVDTTLILVGVADSVDGLIEEHKSIERALVQVPMPRMSRPEVTQIIEKGLEAVGMTIAPGAKEWIADLSQGLPHYTHSLGLYSAIRAVDNDRMDITAEDVAEATKKIVTTPHTILSAYHKATSSPQKQNIYEQVLLACGLAKKDELGYFPAAAVSKPLSVIMKKKYDVPSFSRHLSHFCDPKRGGLLQRKGEPRKLRYRFADPMMQPFIIIHGYASQLLSKELLQKIRDVQHETT